MTLPLVPGLTGRLGDGIDVADVGCGSGHAVNLMAEAFPRSRFTGFDFSESGIAAARAEAGRRGLPNARFEQRDAARLGETARFDLVTSFDAVHDQARPDLMLAGIARPVSTLTRAIASGLRKPTARMPSGSSTASPSGAPGIGSTVPAGACVSAGARAGSGTSVRAGAGITPTAPRALGEAVRAPAGIPLAPSEEPPRPAVPHPVPVAITTRASRIGRARRSMGTRQIVGGPRTRERSRAEVVRNRLSEADGPAPSQHSQREGARGPGGAHAGRRRPYDVFRLAGLVPAGGGAGCSGRR